LWKQHKPTADYNWTASTTDVSFTDTSSGSLAWWWDFDDGTFSNEQNPTHIFLSPGDYSVKLYVENNIKSWDQITKTVTVSSLTTKTFDINSLNLFPNPATETIQVKWQSSNRAFYYRIVDVSGKSVYSNQMITNGEIISLANLEKGLYFITFYQDDYTKTIKVIKN
jgi:PKD repeat protein